MTTAASKVLTFTQTDAEFTEFFERAQEISDLGNLLGLLGWDQQVKMPPQANQVRGPQLATLQALLHERQTHPRIGELLNVLEPRVQGDGYSDADRGLVRLMRRNYDQNTKIPAALVKEVAVATAEAWGTWEQAKPANDFASFAPYLRKLVKLMRQVADHLGYQGSPYNALLDQYEPDMTLDTLNPILDRVRDATVDLLRRIQESGQKIDTSCLHGNFDPARQLDLCKALLQKMGYHFDAGRMDQSSHPFTGGGGSPFDVRLTVRVDPTYFPAALMAAAHEGGHGLYEQGSDPALARTILAGGASMGLHESESRLWENAIGRSLPFWKHHIGLLRDAFPETFSRYGVEALVPALNEVKPSLIRVEADEVTYNLHIIIRFELEQGLINGDIDVDDLPSLWNQKYESYLGVTPPTDTQGVLQDIHWSGGSFGYFPTYTLGNLYAAQIYHTLHRAFPDYDQRLEAEGTGFILDWLREHMYASGQVYAPDEVARKVTGETLNPEYFVQYINAKFGALYGLSA
ncbi:MAG TPA: carboxypeptidase M32 [Ktedonobacterales bacterium]|nr:carboxypeptidase M32 [Ktedonobacterales bacterium]